jgi:hypothetical protein
VAAPPVAQGELAVLVFALSSIDAGSAAVGVP